MAQSIRPMSDPRTLAAALVESGLPTGGWPYRTGHSPRLEPTVWSLLALSAQPDPPSEAVERGLAWLRSLQQSDGLLVEPSTPGANYGWNGLVLLAAAAIQGTDTSDMVSRLIAGILAAKGVQVAGESGVIRQDGRLQAWSWVEGTFSWVEPTAYCLLGLKKVGASGPVATARMSEAAAVLFDRECQGGGWNYGNSQVYGQDLRPYVPTTALTLLALQDETAHAAVDRGLAWLRANALSERSTMALALAAVCLRTFDRPEPRVLEALRQQVARTLALGNLHLTAMATYALSLGQHQARAFALR